MNAKVTKLKPFGILVEPSTPLADIKDVNMEHLRSLFEEEHLVVLRGFRHFSDQNELTQYCEKWGEISLWPFGKVLELIEQESPEDHIFDNNYVPLHWDGMYRPQVPEIQIFHCVRAPGVDNGGKTTFSNTAMVYAQASKKQVELWSQVTGVYERKMEFYHSKTVAPVIAAHPVKGFPVIRYCEPPKQDDDSFVNHPNYEFQGISGDEATEFMQDLKEALYSEKNFYAHEWQSGDVVISDNHTLLHGRDAFTSGAPRHLRRVHVLGQPALDNPHLVFHS